MTTTPLVYQPGSDDGPGVVSAVWTGGDGGWQVILMSDGENSYDDGAPDGEPQGDPWPLRLPGVTGFSQFKSMGEPGWGDDVPVFRPGDVEAARGLTGLAKMVHDHGLPVSRRAADSNGRVVVYTFTDGTTYMEPVEPPSEQYINSAAVMVPGGVALSRGKGLTGAARAIAAEAIDDAATSRASQAANAATGGYLRWIPAPIASILFGGKPKPRVSGVVDDGAEAVKNAATTAAKGADDVVEAVGARGVRPTGTPVPRQHTRVFRAVGEDEYHDIVSTGRLREGPNSLEGKWFADSLDGAIAHGKALFPDGRFRLVEVDVPDDAPSLFRQPNLDGRGPARFVQNDDLPALTPRPLEPGE
ncbi:MAG: hypothetical protein WCJ31_00820 [Planctomycetia bacterium]